MRAYLREDGNYDLYTVEPTVVSAAEYETMVKKEKLEARKAELLEELQAIDKELSEPEVKPIPEVVVEPVAANNEEIPTRRPW